MSVVSSGGRMATEQDIEQEINDKGLNAPRVNPQKIDEQILSSTYIRPAELNKSFDLTTFPALRCLTICVIVTTDGFTFVGKAACASPENFDRDLGEKIAFEDARRQIWSHEGYLLKALIAGRVTKP